MIRALPHIQTMAAYALADLGDSKTISMAQNESAFAASPDILSAVRSVSEEVPLYPDPDWSDLRATIADLHGLDPTRILCGAGSMELIGCLIRAYAGPGDRVLGTEYGYAYVATASTQVQADFVKARETHLTISVDEILAAMSAETRIVFVCNPGNPTGTLIPNSEIIRLRKDLPQDVLLVIDQAYAEFSDFENDPSEVFALVDGGKTVIMRTLSKAYGLAGARVGWGYFPPNVAGEVRKLLNPNNVSILSQAMAIAALQDQPHMRETVRRTAEIRDGFAEECRALGLSVPQSHTNFVLLGFDSEDAATKADTALREANLLMRGMDGYGLPNCLRATVCQPEVMDRALTVLKGVVT